MGNDFRRDHSFRNPRPDQSLRYGTPNACTGCHSDKSDAWAATQVVKWYGEKRPQHFSDTLLIASENPVDPEQRQKVYSFIKDITKPAIARATALEYLPVTGTEDELRVFLEALKDSAELVRYHALLKFTSYPDDQRLTVALNTLGDSSRSVRATAARLTVEQDTLQLLPKLRKQWARAQSEYREMLDANADFPLGRLQYGDFHFRQGDIRSAIEQYEIALEMDPFLSQVHSNLATAYNIAGEDSLALSTLDKLIVLEPEFDFAYYLRGLLKHEMADPTGAIDDLTKAVELFPDNFRYLRNLSNMLYQEGRISEALPVARRALALAPESVEMQRFVQLLETSNAQ